MWNWTMKCFVQEKKKTKGKKIKSKTNGIMRIEVIFLCCRMRVCLPNHRNQSNTLKENCGLFCISTTTTSTMSVDRNKVAFNAVIMGLSHFQNWMETLYAQANNVYRVVEDSWTLVWSWNGCMIRFFAASLAFHYSFGLLLAQHCLRLGIQLFLTISLDSTWW